MLGAESAFYTHGSAPWDGLAGDQQYLRADKYAETYNTPEEIDYCVNHCPLPECVDCYGHAHNGLRGRECAEKIAEKTAYTEKVLLIAVKQNWSVRKFSAMVHVSFDTCATMMAHKKAELMGLKYGV